MPISITQSPFNASTGNADNATNIQAAINSVSAADGDGIYIPQGIFKTGPISVQGKKNVHIYSDSGVLRLIDNAPTVLILGTHYQPSLLWVDDASTNFRITGVTFDGNSANQSSAVHATPPFTSSSALLQINADNTIVEDVTVLDTDLRGISVSGVGDTDRVLYPMIRNCKVVGSGNEGISTFFAVAPQISGCVVSQAGGSFVPVTNVSGTTITTASSFTHNVGTMIAFFQREGTPGSRFNYKYKGSVVKGSQVVTSSSFTVPSTAFVGNSGSLTLISNLYLLSHDSAHDYPHGIIHSNSHNGRIEDCYVEYTANMGIGIVADLGESGIITGCAVKNSGAEGICIDACRSAMITSCSTDACSVNSNSPDFHVASDSPHIADTQACNVIGNTSRNGLGTSLINCGLSFDSGNVLISGNHVFRDTTFNWPTSLGINVVGPNATVEGNFVNGIDNGVQIVNGESSMVRSNSLTGRSSSNSAGVISNNSARTIVQGNTIHGYTAAVGVAGQGAYKVIDNFIRTCSYALDDQLGAATDTVFSNNHSFVSTALFQGAEPFVVQDNYYQTAKSARTTYSGTPITYTPPTGGLLRIVADGNFAVPAEKLFRVFRYDATRWILYELGGGAINPTSIDVVATINTSTGQVSMSVSGVGGGKALTYYFSSYFNTIL